MDRSKEYLLTLLGAYYHGDTVRLDSDIDYNRLFTLARCHNLSATLFCVIKNAPNSDTVNETAYRAFEDAFFGAICADAQQTAAYDEICRLLTDNSIRYVPFKGIVLKNMYPVRETRVMGDIDLLISPNDKQKAQKTLIYGGVKPDKLGGPVQEYLCRGVKIELHTKIINDRINNHDLGELFGNIFDNASFGNGYRGRIDDETHFTYLIAHIAHHFCFYGAGAKMILDLAVMLRECNIDCDRVVSRLDEQGLGKFAKTILTVCHKWFGIGTDYGADTAETEAFLLSYGAFGNMNRNKAAVVQRREMERGATKPQSKLKLLFPPYSKMRELPYIRFIDGRPYMLPAAWIYRVIYNMKNRRGFVFNTVSEMGSDKTSAQAEKELEFFKKIGLL